MHLIDPINEDGPHVVGDLLLFRQERYWKLSITLSRQHVLQDILLILRY